MSLLPLSSTAEVKRSKAILSSLVKQAILKALKDKKPSVAATVKKSEEKNTIVDNERPDNGSNFLETIIAEASSEDDEETINRAVTEVGSIIYLDFSLVLFNCIFSVPLLWSFFSVCFALFV